MEPLGLENRRASVTGASGFEHRGVQFEDSVNRRDCERRKRAASHPPINCVRS